MHFLQEERETHLSYNPISDRWDCYTNIRKHITLFKKRGWTITREDIDSKGNTYQLFANAPKNAISIRTAKEKTDL